MRACLLMLMFTFAMSLDARSKLLPEYDKRCNFMNACHAEVSPHKIKEQKDYFNKDIPSTVHQIWLGNKDAKPKKTSEWFNFSAKYKYQYKLWTEDSLNEVKEFASPKNFEYIIQFISTENFWAASDIMRFEILKKFGGIYADCDFSPPKYEGKIIDMRDISPMKGLTVVTENKARDVGESALFVMNGFVMACPDHPVIVSVTEQFDKNIDSWYKKTDNYDAMFITGPFLFNRVLFGSFTVLPQTYLNYFGMY